MNTSFHPRGPRRKGPKSRGLQSNVTLAFDRHGDVVELLGEPGRDEVAISSEEMERSRGDFSTLFDRLLARSDGGRR